ncbi:hypothetical protein OPV22_004550 [Ensete ventricosum]|uniref:Protein kinase domain-containing protein n=1 Tax=Ensete ventricosum TaxID=4639 RepID=A0AAV8RJ32_ENSVE|nr:hypothetical protein OPV22_004550 [Ensete ventricosum]
METVTCALPEPAQPGPSIQSAPPSVRNRTKPAQSGHRILNSRAWALSAPSTLVVADQYALASLEYGDQEECKGRVTRLLPSCQGLKEFLNEVNVLASLQHPCLCKLLGFHAQEGSDEQMLIYERLYHGSLDRLLRGGLDGRSMDWVTRMKVALCAAKGLAFLHEEGPFQAMYYEFSTSNIQVDKDFSAKLSGYGCASYNPEAGISDSSIATANLSVETLEKGLLTPKSNVWSFGIVLLELLTGIPVSKGVSLPSLPELLQTLH